MDVSIAFRCNSCVLRQNADGLMIPSYTNGIQNHKTRTSQ